MAYKMGLKTNARAFDWVSLPSINNKNPNGLSAGLSYQVLTTKTPNGLSTGLAYQVLITKTPKRPPVVTTVPSGTQRHHWYTGLYLRIFDSGSIITQQPCKV